MHGAACWLLASVVVVGAVPKLVPQPKMSADQAATEQFLLELQSRQSSDSSGLSWLRQNSVSEAFSVLFPIAGLNPLICRTAQDDQFDLGICLRVTDCLYYSGESYGSCGGGIGSCCVFANKCADTTNMFVSHFVNPTFSSVDRGTGECKLTVNPMNSNICQYRIDFDIFEILGPDRHSNCVDDFFGVTGGSSVPKVCGVMTGQHMYINVKPGGGPIVITMDTSSVKTMARKWNIKITQIGCNAPERAPAGCLQFFNETSGTVKSFNFRRKSAPDAEDSRQLQNLNYGVCVNSKVGYCDLTWTQSSSNDYTFTVSDISTGGADTLKSKRGTGHCTTDFITIPGGTYVHQPSNKAMPAERFCGTKFPEVKTASQPYTFHVVTNADEEGDSGNLGFEVNFRQNLCY